MQNLEIKKEQYTPQIDLDSENHKITIEGKSYPENTFTFYKPVLMWIEEYFKNVDEHLTSINLDLEYLNSSSMKAYFDIFDLIESAHARGKNIKIYWYYDKDNDIAQEIGEDFIEDFQTLDIQLLEKD